MYLLLTWCTSVWQKIYKYIPFLIHSFVWDTLYNPKFNWNREVSNMGLRISKNDLVKQAFFMKIIVISHISTSELYAPQQSKHDCVSSVWGLLLNTLLNSGCDQKILTSNTDICWHTFPYLDTKYWKLSILVHIFYIVKMKCWKKGCISWTNVDFYFLIKGSTYPKSREL